MGFQRHDQSESVANSRGKMERSAQQPITGMRTASRLASTPGSKVLLWITASKPLLFGFDGFFHQRRGFQNMMQAGERFALFEQAQHRAAAEIFGISELESRCPARRNF